jgi:hypothetical protein
VVRIAWKLPESIRCPSASTVSETTGNYKGLTEVRPLRKP